MYRESILTIVRKLNDDQLERALLNVGTDIQCGGCMCSFFTGHLERCDEGCRTPHEAKVTIDYPAG